jgi:formylmethanofuran dehydrogenase subunit C
MLRFRRSDTGSLPIEISNFTPDQFLNRSVSEIETAPALIGNTSVAIAEIFRIDGEVGPDWLIEGDSRQIKGIGRKMASGSIFLTGSAGMHLGAEMTGGTIVADASVSDWAGAEMRGGKIEIRGDAGNRVGGCYLGSTKGMRGGIIQIRGNAGSELGCSMRRGLILVEGDCGQYAGSDLIAGTLLLNGKVGSRLGAGMKRGSIICLNDSPELVSSFVLAGHEQPTWVRLLQQHLHELQPSPSLVDSLLGVSFTKYRGDRLTIGRGEILVRSP